MPRRLHILPTDGHKTASRKLAHHLIASTRTRPSYIGERREDDIGVLRCIAETPHYLMVRRAGCHPVVTTIRKWRALPLAR